MSVFFALIAVGGFVNLAVLTVVAWLGPGVVPVDTAWIDDRTYMARGR